MRRGTAWSAPAGRLIDWFQGIVGTPDGKGSRLVSHDPGVLAFGGAPFLGSMAGKTLAHWIVSITPTP